MKKILFFLKGFNWIIFVIFFGSGCILGAMIYAVLPVSFKTFGFVFGPLLLIFGVLLAYIFNKKSVFYLLR